MCDQVIPVMSELASVDEGSNVQLEMLKLFAEISEFAGELEDIEERVERVYEKLIVSNVLSKKNLKILFIVFVYIKKQKKQFWR